MIVATCMGSRGGDSAPIILCAYDPAVIGRGGGVGHLAYHLVSNDEKRSKKSTGTLIGSYASCPRPKSYLLTPQPAFLEYSRSESNGFFFFNFLLLQLRHQST